MGKEVESRPPDTWRRRFAARAIPIAFYLTVVGISGVGFLAYYPRNSPIGVRRSALVFSSDCAQSNVRS